MQFDLNEEQIEIRDIVQRFTAQEITPHAEAWDETNHFPREIYHKMAELGLMGMTTPEEYGGSALSRLANTLVYEELARGEMATAVGLSVHNMVTGSIARFGNQEQRRRWVPELASGKLLGAFSLSEADSGSDAASLQCKAERHDDLYILERHKNVGHKRRRSGNLSCNGPYRYWKRSFRHQLLCDRKRHARVFIR